ncbi:hypothetical protein AB0F15_16320 [Amycolatopsis sp. NPDC026612]|uniref:hypothetical protein n=1 Tax=Amycolatopsis sp. NPDC026612 TaxID=3155466 RepID=UPI0033C319CD
MDLLAQWMITGRATRLSPPPQPGGGLRFAFYGRTSTTRHQDRVSSQGWQRDMAEDLITGHGRILTAYFDSGTSRRIPWSQRPQASQLMATISAPEHAIDAIVVSEYERAFTGKQFATLHTWCTRVYLRSRRSHWSAWERPSRSWSTVASPTFTRIDRQSWA